VSKKEVVISAFTHKLYIGWVLYLWVNWTGATVAAHCHDADCKLWPVRERDSYPLPWADPIRRKVEIDDELAEFILCLFVPTN